MRPEDIPLLDRSILEPILENAAREMAQAFPEQTEKEWAEDLKLALLKGDVLIVIDDRRKRIGLVRADRPPFLGLSASYPAADIGAGDPDDPLGIKRWENLPPPSKNPQRNGNDG